MSLQKQLVHLNMSGGLQKKDDSFLVIPSKLSVADNVEFDDLSTVKKRGGQVSATLPAGYSTAVRGFRHNDNLNIEFGAGETIRANGSTIPSDFGMVDGSFLAEFPRFYPRVGAVTRRVQALTPKSTAPGAGAPLYDRNFDVAVGANYYCIAWETPGYTGRMAIKYEIRTIVGDQAVVGGMYTATGAGTDIYVKPRVLYDATNARFAVFYAHFLSGGTNFDVEGFYIPEAGGATGGAGVMVAVTAGGAVEGVVGQEALFDVAVSAGNGYAVVARQTNAAGNVFMRSFNLSLAALCATANAAPAAKPVSLTAHATFSAGVLTTHALYGAGANLRGFRQPSNTGVITAEATITTIATKLVGRVAVTDAGAGLYIACDVFSATTDVYATTYLVNATTAHVLSSQCAIATNCFLAGRIFTLRTHLMLPMIFTSQQYQSVTLLLDLTSAADNLGATTSTTPYFAARLDYGETANPSPLASDSAHRVPGASPSFMPYLKSETDLRLAGTTVTTPVAVVAAVFSATEQLGHAEINGLTYLAGACPLMTDGVQLVEENFHWAPEVVGTVSSGLVTVSPVATGTGIYDFPAVGTYYVAFTESWQDSAGNWHESGTAFLGSVTTTLGNLGINPTVIRPPSLKRTQKLTMYRTPLLGTDTSLYLAHTLDLGAGSGYVTDTTLASGEQLYTEGGVLPNTPMPACRHLSLFQKRLVASGCGDGSRVYCSKASTPGYGVEFSSGDPLHQTVVPVEAGRCVGTQEMDDRLVVLCERGVGVISGSGPAPTGTAGQYSDFSTVVTETGCEWDSPKSIIRGPEGVWFRSPFGIRLVSRSGALARGQDGKQVGAEVDPLVAGTVVAIAGDAKQQVRFYQSSGTCLVWDYQWQQWTRFTGTANVDAVYADGRYYHLSNYSTTTPLLRYTGESPGYEDVSDAGVAGTVFYGTIETPWLSFAGIQGFQRIYRLMALGKDVGPTGEPHAITLNVYYDFNEGAAGETASAVVSTISNGHIQFQHHFAKQKCESMRIQLVFGASGGGEAALRLTDLTLQVGVKFGYNKLPSSQRF